MLKKIVLLTAVNHADPFNLCSPMLGPLALEAYLARRGGFTVSIVEDLSWLEKLEPDLVGISSVTENYGIAISMARYVKERFAIPVVAGGIHITSLPGSLDPAFDAAVLGEGEETFFELLAHYPHFEKVRGLIFWKEGALVRTGRRKGIEPLDDLPPVNRKKWVARQGLPVVMTSRGCPYACSFCSSPLMWGGCRTFSPRYVVGEIQELVRLFGARYIRFFDDVLTLGRKRLVELVEMIRSEGLHDQVTFSCFSRFNLLDHETLRLLAKGNIKFVNVGLESASGTVLESLKDRPVTVQESQEVIDMACDEGIAMGLSIIIGTPGETEDDLLATYAFLSKNREKLCEIEVNPLVPNPGTPTWDRALERGLVGTSMDWSLLKDCSFMPLFDEKRYIYLNEAMPYDTFLTYLRGFMSLYRDIVKRDVLRGYFGEEAMVAALHPPA